MSLSGDTRATNQHAPRSQIDIRDVLSAARTLVHPGGVDSGRHRPLRPTPVALEASTTGATPPMRCPILIGPDDQGSRPRHRSRTAAPGLPFVRARMGSRSVSGRESNVPAAEPSSVLMGEESTRPTCSRRRNPGRRRSAVPGQGARGQVAATSTPSPSGKRMRCAPLNSGVAEEPRLRSRSRSLDSRAPRHQAPCVPSGRPGPPGPHRHDRLPRRSNRPARGQRRRRM